MNVIEINIVREGNNIARASGLIIKSNNFYRHVFIPSLILNKESPEQNLRAKFIVQKKNKNDSWEKYNTIKITDLKAGELFSLDISSRSLNLLINYCNELKSLNRNEGFDNLKDTSKIMIIGETTSVEDIKRIYELIKNNENSSEILSTLIKLSPEKVSEYLNDDNNTSKIVDKLSLNSANNLYNHIRIKCINNEYIKNNLSNEDETFWQNLFKDNPIILSLLFPHVFQLIQSQPYLGGKMITNKGGSIGDYLYQFGSNNSCIIEIKTPKTLLVNKNEYRSAVYSPSSELTGTIVQCRIQKDNYIKSFYNIQGQSKNKDLEALDPKVYIIAGNQKDYSSEQLACFELFRRELKDIEIITYDEIVFKLKLIEDAFLIE